MEEIVTGIAEGCVQAKCQLIGGETAEMPEFYSETEYDLAGFSVGVIDRQKIIDKKKIKAGDIIIGLASSGVHSNGYSLVRKILNLESSELNRQFAEFSGKTLGEILLTPTKIYVKSILELYNAVDIKGIAHITGGGLYENIPRCLPDGLSAKIEKKKIKQLPIFQLIAKQGKIPERDMYNTFNMGVGMTVVVAKENVDRAVDVLRALGEEADILGEIVLSDESVILC